MNYIKRYKKRVGLGAKSPKEFTLNEIERNFIRYLNENPTAREVQITEPEEITVSENTQKVLCAIHDLSNNDKRALDEKQILLPKDANVDVGCYLIFDNCYWIIIFKEHRSIDSHKKFIIRRCNQILKYMLLGEVYEIPVSIENLTMYSDGLADLKFTSQQDAKRMITFGSNPVTRTILANTRMMLTGKTVFRVTHINDFEYNGRYSGSDGIIKTLVLQTTIRDEDDLENNIAWNDISAPPKEIPIEKEIIGDSSIMVGSKKKYMSEDLEFTTSWKIETSNNENYKEYLDFKINEFNEAIIVANTNVNNIGKTFDIVLYNVQSDEEYDRKTVSIKGFL